MAERRMFSKQIIDSDAFLEMPQSSQNLYFHLSMRADDDGFINSPKRIARMIGCSDDDMKVLIAKSFIIPFDSGVVVIKHWRINNYIRNDRKQETNYIDEMSQLKVKENGAYTLCQADGSHMVGTRYTEYSIGEDSIGKYSINNSACVREDTPAISPVKRFVKPTLEDVQSYCKERNNNINPQNFIDFYESKGWRIGNQHMKDWKACVRTWEQKDRTSGQVASQKRSNFAEREYSKNEIDAIFAHVPNIEDYDI